MADAQTAFPKPQGSRSQVRTPEPRPSRERMNGHKDAAERSPSTPGHLAPFDWDEFEARYEEALADADREEQELLKEFEDLVKVSQIRVLLPVGLCQHRRSSSTSGPLLPRSMTPSAE